MAKIALVALMVLAATSSTLALTCYQCSDCKEYAGLSKECADPKATGCFIRGDPVTETWNRGCGQDEKRACDALEEAFACSFCGENDCNGSAFVAGSIVLSLGLAAAAHLLR